MLGLAFVLTPHVVPLYDGVGFPDEPYRYVTAQGGRPAATTAEVSLPVAGGVNTGGLIANSAERGPQVSLFAPPKAFATTGTGPVVVTVEPVPLAGPRPPGRVDSNVYALTFTSPDGAVRLVPEAQQPALTMRAVSSAHTTSEFQYRPSAGIAWRMLPTRRVGEDIFNTPVPGAGEFVLVQLAGPRRSGGHTGVYAVLGAGLGLLVLILVGVRILSRRTGA